MATSSRDPHMHESQYACTWTSTSDMLKAFIVMFFALVLPFGARSIIRTVYFFMSTEHAYAFLNSPRSLCGNPESSARRNFPRSSIIMSYAAA